jgi:hypothetical protein
MRRRRRKEEERGGEREFRGGNHPDGRKGREGRGTRTRTHAM